MATFRNSTKEVVETLSFLTSIGFISNNSLPFKPHNFVTVSHGMVAPQHVCLTP